MLFERGAFGPVEANATAAALAAYAAGLPAFVLIKVMTPGFFARHDTATPVKVAFAAMATNLVLTVVLGLVLPFAHVGVATATSIAGWVNALSLMVLLHRRGHFTLDARSRRRRAAYHRRRRRHGRAALADERGLAAPLYAGAFIAPVRRAASWSSASRSRRSSSWRWSSAPRLARDQAALRAAWPSASSD